MKPAAEKSPSNASASRVRRLFIRTKLVASTKEYSRSSRCRKKRRASSSCDEDPSPGRSLQAVQESYGRGVPGAPPKIGPGLAADVVGGHDAAVFMQLKESQRFLVMGITSVAQGDPERRVGEDHR